MGPATPFCSLSGWLWLAHSFRQMLAPRLARELHYLEEMWLLDCLLSMGTSQTVKTLFRACTDNQQPLVISHIVGRIVRWWNHLLKLPSEEKKVLGRPWEVGLGRHKAGQVSQASWYFRLLLMLPENWNHWHADWQINGSVRFERKLRYADVLCHSSVVDQWPSIVRVPQAKKHKTSFNGSKD